MKYRITNSSKRTEEVFGVSIKSDKSVVMELTSTELDHVKRHAFLSVKREKKEVSDK